jgi:hypothetical protein
MTAADSLRKKTFQGLPGRDAFAASYTCPFSRPFMRFLFVRTDLYSPSYFRPAVTHNALAAG